jgi:glycosyltransferase involved in cell wall biosynthesis
MNLIVDGIIYYYQQHGGIPRLYRETLPRLCDMEPALAVTLLSYPNGSATELPAHHRIAQRTIPWVHRYARPRPLWARYYPQLHILAARALVGRSRGKVWLSTYYTSPPAWEGLRICVAYDFIYEKFRLTHWKDNLAHANETIRSKARAIAEADLIICISEAARQDLKNYYGSAEGKTAVVHLAHRPTFTRLARPAGDDQDRFILYVGRRDPYKDFDLLLGAYAEWPKHGSISLICVGGWEWTKEERARIDRLGLHGRVRLEDQANDERLCELYNRASAFVFPSQGEGFGIPLLEAMACGCPIVASRIPSSLEVADEVPVYFSPGDAEGLVAALDQAVNDGRSSQRVSRGLELATEFSWEKTARGFLQAIRTVC